MGIPPGFNIGNYTPGFIAYQGQMNHNGFEYTDQATSFRGRRESIYAANKGHELEWLKLRLPKYGLYDAVVQEVGDAKTRMMKGKTPVGVPAIHPISQGMNTVYRTGTGTDGDTAPVVGHNTAVEQVIQTKVGNVFQTPFPTTHPFMQTSNKVAYTQFMLPGVLQTPTVGEYQIQSGQQVGCNLFLAGDDVQFMDNPRQYLDYFAENGMNSLEFHKNFEVHRAAHASGVITVTPGDYGNDEILGQNNQVVGGDGYAAPSLFNPASISGAYAGAFKETAQRDGMQRNALGNAMTGTQRIRGRNVPTKILGAGTGINGTGQLTKNELMLLRNFRNMNEMSDEKFTLFVDSQVGISQIQNIPELQDTVFNTKAQDFNTQQDRKVTSTPYGIDIMACSSFVPMGATNTYRALFVATGGKEKPFKAIVNEKANIREIDLPMKDPERPNILLRLSQQIGVGLVDPSKVAVVPYANQVA